MIFCLQLAGLSGCAKEYSFEGSPPSDTLPKPDTVRRLFILPACQQCKPGSDFEFLKWSFSYDTSLACGNITNAIIARDRSAFTFFGPSACSEDSGVVITVFLKSELLDRDRSNITTNSVVFEYYDNTSQSDVFISRKDEFQLTIETYNDALGTAKGRFNGIVHAKDGSPGQIKSGIFSLKFQQ